MNPSSKMTGKLSHLIRAGAIVHTVDGGVYRVTSKLASGGEVYVRLANLQGKPVPTPADFKPIGPALARFAAWMRLAYNKDFDLYVKEYIKAAGLPVDPTMDWSKFFQARIAPKLMSKDEEVQDEAIHQLIIKTMVERNVLANFNQAIKRFPERIQNLPLERQVTTFLMQTFNWRLGEANEYIKNVIYQDETSSMWGEGDTEEGDVNILDTKEDALHDKGFDRAEADIDVSHFREGFEGYLQNKYQKTAVRYKADHVNEDGSPAPWVVYYKSSGLPIAGYATREEAMANNQSKSGAVDQYLQIFDILYSHLREGDLPTGANVYSDWKEEMKDEGEVPSPVSFKFLFSNLPKLIDSYVTKFLKSDVNPFVDIMRQIGKERRSQAMEPIMGGLKLAEEFPINHDIAPDSSTDSGGGFSAMPSLGEAEGVGGELAELAPLAMAASLKPGEFMDGNEKKKRCRSCGATLVKGKCPVDAKTCGRNKKDAAQWESPKCKGCGKSIDLRDCPACQEKFCGDCILNHHANNPSHDRVASSLVASFIGGLED